MASPQAGVPANPRVLETVPECLGLASKALCYMSHSPIKIKVAKDKEWKGKQENYVEGTRQVSIYVSGTLYSKKRQPKISI